MEILLSAVGDIDSYESGQRIFTNSHNSPLGTVCAMPMGQQWLQSFPQFHNAHHNNKPYSP